MFSKIFDAYLKFVTNRPRVTLALVFLTSSFFAYFGKSIVIDNDFRKMVVQGTEDFALLDHHNEVFGPDDTSLIVILTPKDANIERLIPLIEELSDAFLEIEGAIRVDSITHTSIIHMRDDALLISPAFGSKSLLDGGPEDRLRLLRNSATAGYVVSADGSSFLVSVSLDGSYKEVGRVSEPASMVVTATEEIVARSGLQLDVHFAGVPFTRLGAVEGIKKDLALLMPIASLIIAFLLFFQFPRLHAVLLPLSVIGIACTITLGIAALLGEAITPLSGAFPTLLLVIGIGDSLHFLSRYHQERRGGASPQSAAIESGRTVGRACFLTSFTSALGFGSLCLTNMPILQGFGLISSVGILTAFVVQITVMPLGLSLVRSPALAEQRRLSATVRSIAQGIAKPGRPLVVTVFGALVCLAAGWASRDINVNYYFTKVLGPEHSASLGNAVLDEAFSGLLSVDVNLQGPPGSFKDPAILQKMDDLLAASQEHPGLKRAFGVPTVVKELHREFAQSETIPANPAVVGQLLFLTEANGEILRRIVNADYSEARLTFSKSYTGGDDSLLLRDLLEEHISRIFKDTDIEATVTGIFLLSASGFSRLVGELVQSLLIALAVIIATLTFVFGSVRIGLASVVPNLLPLLVVLGVYGLSGKEIELMPAVMFCIALGVAVDDTIHLMARFYEERTRHSTMAQAIEHAVQHSVGPVVNTTVVLVAGFSVIALSSFPANHTAGLLGGAIVLVALLADLVLVPAGLALFCMETSDDSA